MSVDVAVMDRAELVAPVVPERAPLEADDSQRDATSGASESEATASTKSPARQYAGYLYELTKPRIVWMVLITAGVAAFFMAGTAMSMMGLFHLMVGTAFVAGSASVLNQFIERDVDAQMTRTMKRPIPRGDVSPAAALMFGLLIGLGGTLYLGFTLGIACASVGVATWAGYVLVYTPLKQMTAWNTTVGAVAGALPMLMGYTAAGGDALALEGWLLVAVLFLWQYPHFMAIAWMYRKQYGDAGFVMTPNVEPTGKSAGLQAIAGALALPAVMTALVWSLSYAPVFIILSILASAGMIRSAFRFYRTPDDVTARKLLRSSLLQLPASMVVLMIARLLTS